jgi:hypothetical protein
MEPQIKGLQKLVNSDIIKNIYPMVDRIVVELYDSPHPFNKNKEIKILEFEIYLNDPDITEENMYEKGFDPHYLVEYHIRNLLPYIGLESDTMTFVVYGPEGNRIDYYTL